MRTLLVTLLLLGACSSNSTTDNTPNGTAGSSQEAAGGGGQNPAETCPNIGGSWKVTEHCDATLVGMVLSVNEANCALTFDSPFNAFSGSVSKTGVITLSGPQQCTGTGTASSIAMTCSPGTCKVTLTR